VGIGNFTGTTPDPFVGECAACHAGQLPWLADFANPWKETGHARAFERILDPANPFQVAIVGADPNRKFLPTTLAVVPVDGTGQFELFLPLNPGFREIVCLFAGSMELAASSCGFVPLELTATLRLTPETLNLKSHGQWVTARIAFDADVAGIVDAASLMLEGISADWIRVLDGHTILAKFSREALIAVLSPAPSVTLCVEGRLTDGRSFTGCDTIRVIRP